MSKIHFFSGDADKDMEKSEATQFINQSSSHFKFKLEDSREKGYKQISCLEGKTLRVVLSGLAVEIEELWELIPADKRM